VKTDDGQWGADIFNGHAIGCNAVSWAPATQPGSLITPQPNSVVPGQPPSAVQTVKRFASAGCDNLVKIWGYREDSQSWVEEETLEGHTDWVRDVAWAPNIGLPRSYIATASQVRRVFCCFAQLTHTGVFSGQDGAHMDKRHTYSTMGQDCARLFVGLHLSDDRQSCGGWEVSGCGLAGLLEPCGQPVGCQLWGWEGYALERELAWCMGVCQRYDELKGVLFLIIIAGRIPIRTADIFHSDAPLLISRPMH
jgi:hypothetical protein